MSYSYTCDWCGETIGQSEFQVDLESEGKGDGAPESWRAGWIGHYHYSEARPCWPKVRDAIRLLADFGPVLARPAATAADIDAARRGHVRTCDPDALDRLGERWLGELGLNGATFRALAVHVDTVGELCGLTKQDVAAVKGIGDGRVNEIVDVLAAHDLALAPAAAELEENFSSTSRETDREGATR